MCVFDLIPWLDFRTQTNCSTQFEFEFRNSAQFKNSPGMDAPARVWCMTHDDATPGFKSTDAPTGSSGAVAAALAATADAETAVEGGT